MKRGQINSSNSQGIAIVLVIIVLVLLAALGKWGADSKPTPDVLSPSSSCNVSVFLEEYNYSLGYQNSLILNKESYVVLYVPSADIYLPISDEDCSLTLDEQNTKSLLTGYFLSSSVRDIDITLYRDLATCYGASAAARPFCSATTTTNEVNSNPAVQAAVDNEKTTVSIVNKLAPEGWKKETVDVTKNLIRLSKEIKGPGQIALVFEVVDTTSCFMKDSISVAIYDYSLNVGDDLWYRIKNKNFHTGIAQDMYAVNDGLSGFMSTPDSASLISNLFANVVGGKNCNLNAYDTYAPKLSSINEKIKSSISSGGSKGMQYLQWISPIKTNAELARMNSLQDTNATDAFSLEGHFGSVLLITKIPDYLDAKGHYERAEILYARGLFYSSTNEYGLLETSMKSWRSANISDYVLSAIIWVVVFALIGFYIHMKLGDGYGSWN